MGEDLDPRAAALLDGDPEFVAMTHEIQFYKHFPAWTEEKYRAAPYQKTQMMVAVADVYEAVHRRNRDAG